MVPRAIDLLTRTDMERFGAYIAMDLAERAGKRGRRQKRPMVGMFRTWLVATVAEVDSSGRAKRMRRVPLPFRGSDFSLRVALQVRGWLKTGLGILAATEKVARKHEPFLRCRLGYGRRGRRSTICAGVTEIDETVRTEYYKFIRRWPAIDVLLETWFWDYVHWFDWVAGVDERVIELTVRDYHRLGHPESARAFQAFADRVRRNPRLWHPAVGWPYRRIPLGRGDDISANVAVSSLTL
jgi:hypothetical protein